MFRFSRRAGKDEPGRHRGRLLELLVDYPPYLTPFPGQPRALSLAQCEENLHYLLEQRPRRLEIVANLLRQFDIDLSAGLSADDPRPFLESLDVWARAHWPAAYSTAFSADRRVWLPRLKQGEHIVLAMLMDIAIVLGEVLTGKRPDYQWRLDLAPENCDMDSYRRVVMAKNPEDPRWTPVSLDFEFECINSFDELGRDVPGGYPLGYTTIAAIEGGYDPVSNQSIDAVTAETSASRDPHVYDKAEYHVDALVHDYGFDLDQADEQAAVPGALFFGWLASRDLLSKSQLKHFRKEIAAYKTARLAAPALWELFDRSLIDYMLDEKANAFARNYFGSAENGYFSDLTATLAPDLPSCFHVPYTLENQARIDAILDQRYSQWADGHSLD